MQHPSGLIPILCKNWEDLHRGKAQLALVGADFWEESHAEQAKGTGTFLIRLDEAYEYLVENENTICIVSGGQGGNEPCTEAEGMYRYLVDRGISPSRIMMEDQSTDTSENIAYSAKLIGDYSAGVGIVTNNFHVFRGVQLARHQGFENVCGIAARSNVYFQLNNMVREFFGILKDTVCGNLW